MSAPSFSTLHEGFEVQARATPTAIALSDPSGALSYAELNARANRLAHFLQSQGVGPETIVGLYFERSADLLISLLAVLKAGGAYLPLDLACPTERLALMLREAGAILVLTHAPCEHRLPRTAVRVVVTDSPDHPALAEQSASNPTRHAGPDNLAYLMFTSGSTGVPKGVQITHRNVLRLFSTTEPLFGFRNDDVWTLFHTCAFDFSVWEIWGAWLYGGRLVVVPYEVSRSPESFYDLLHRERVTVLNQTPSAFRQLMQADQELGPKALALRLVIFGGEALDLRSLKPWFARHGDQQPRLVNMYGITETTVHVTYRPLTARDTDCASLIGGPLPDLQLHVLNEKLEPVPHGEPGELVVGGPGLARGYLNSPALTAERFMPDPFSVTPGARFYRSGDLARRTPDGDLEYLGRGDQQVKIRGHRIELGEIEARLRQHAGVQDVCVVAWNAASGNRRLAAYVVPRARSSPDPESLRRHLKTTLPDYMVPELWVAMARLPLTVNGKLDRTALPDPTTAGLTSAHAVDTPRTPLEELLAEAWAELLGLKACGVHDHFFALGGNSLLLAQVYFRVRPQLPGDLPFRLFYEALTVADLALAITVHLAAAEREDVEKLLQELENAAAAEPSVPTPKFAGAP